MRIFDPLDKRKEKQEKKLSKRRTYKWYVIAFVGCSMFFVLVFLFCSLSCASRETKGDKGSQRRSDGERTRARDRETSRHSLMGLVSLQICAKGILARVGDVEEAILVLMLLIDGRHQGRCGGKNLVDKDEDGLLGGELDALADHVNKLADSQVRGDEVLFLVDLGNV